MNEHIDPTTGYTLRLIDIDRDAAKLATMWNDSDNQWPGTWTKGVPMTEQRVREWYANENAREVWVWDTGDAIAGYCSLWDKVDEERVVYIAVLNVAPLFQKARLGRKFLTHYVQRAVEIGSSRIDLGTWSGNLKAVPLYKKCGFFWVPDTSVFMHNYIPSILTLPVAQDFFARHDWYTSFQRALTQKEDDERWQGMKVFTYRFAADGEALTVWIDREARAITAVETDRFRVAAIASDITPPRGLKTTMRWELANKSNEPLEISLAANGTRDLKLSHRAALRLAPHETRTLEAAVEVAPKAAANEGKAAPALNTLLVIGGQVLELATGLRPRAAVEVRTYPQRVTLMPGVAQTVELQLRSRLRETVTASVGVASSAGLRADWNQQQIELSPDTWTALPVRLQTDTAGVYTLPIGITVGLDGQDTLLPNEPQQVFALPPGGLLADQSSDGVRIENEQIRVVIERKGAEFTFFERASGEQIAQFGCYSAPPAWPSEFERELFDLSLEQRNGQIVVTASAESKTHPGLRFSKSLSVGAGSIMTVQCALTNRGSEARRIQLRQWFNTNQERTYLTLPLASGLTRDLWEQFPNNQDDDSKQPDALNERWAAFELPALTWGLVWAEDQDETEWMWEAALVSQHYDCPPQQQVSLPPLHLYAGKGDWRAVRELWARLNGATICETQPQAPIDVRLEEPLVATTDGQLQTTLVVSNQRSRQLHGELTLELPEGWRTDTTSFAFDNLTWKNPLRLPISLRCEAGAGAANGRILLRSNELDAAYPFTLLCLGDGRDVVVRESNAHNQQIVQIDNGRFQFDATPAFGGTISSLRFEGVELLASPFPQVATVAWMSPWYGGISPVLFNEGDPFPGKLYSESFTVEGLNWQDQRGNHWTGVRQQATLKAEETRGLQLELDALTTGNSPVVRLVFRLTNTTGATRRIDIAGWIAFVQPDGSRAQTTIIGANHQIKASERIHWLELGHWGAAVNPATGRAVVLVTKGEKVRMSGWGIDGGHLAALTRAIVPPNGIFELVGYLVPAANIAEAERYAALSEL